MSNGFTAPLVSAEVVTASYRLVGYAATVSADSCFVPTDHPANVGDRMRVRLALAGVLEPMEVEAHVVSRRLPRGPGEPGGLLLALILMQREQDKLNALLSGDLDDRKPTDAEIGYRVLVVDDSSLMRDILTHALRRHFRTRLRAVTVDAFGSAEEAVARLVEVTYDLVVVDYYLPNTGGAELIEEIRQSPRHAKVPIIAISVGGAEAREKTMTAGADLFIDKPLVMPQIAITVDRLITKRTSS